MADQQQKGVVFVFDTMRSRSNLFYRWISTSSEVVPIYHPFSVAAFLGPERYTLAAKASPEQRDQYMEMMEPFIDDETYEEATQNFVEAVEVARAKGKIPFANDHAIMTLKQEVMFAIFRGGSVQRENHTVIPDELAENIIPIFVIRHPVNQIDSIVRTVRGQLTPETLEDTEYLTFASSNTPSRHLYDVLSAQGRTPLVIDGDDILWRTNEVARAVCRHIGIDESELSETWAPYSEQERPNQNPYFYVWTKESWDSAGIKRPDQKPESPDLEKSHAKWIKAYGEPLAAAMKRYAEREMTNYLYLHALRA